MNWKGIVAATIFLCSLYALNWHTDRTAFIVIAGLYSLSFVAYLWLVKEARSISFKQLLVIAVLAHAVSMIYEPNLSVDYYRFIWDGEITLMGYNPFDFLPREIANQVNADSPYMRELYSGLSDLSKDNYSCYPPLNQSYFIVSAMFSSSVWLSVFIMKLLIVATEILGAVYLLKLLKHFSIDKVRIWILYLNPLWIIECTGNVHFEGVMLSFLIIAFYFIFTQKLILAGVFFALAVQMKIVPLLLLPFFLRFLGFKKAALFYSVTIVLAIGIGLFQINGQNVGNFFKSLALYFRVFEFNSFIYYNINRIGKIFLEYNPSRIFGPIISLISMFLILRLALKDSIVDWRQLFTKLLFGFFLFLILSGTMHPWYLLPILVLSIFTNFAFPVFWSYLIFFSYFFYQVGLGTSVAVRLMVGVEYFILFALLYSELKNKGTKVAFLSLATYFHPPSFSKNLNATSKRSDGFIAGE